MYVAAVSTSTPSPIAARNARTTRDGFAPDRPDNAAPEETSGDFAGRLRVGSARAVSAFDAATTSVDPVAQLVAISGRTP